MRTLNVAETGCAKGLPIAWEGSKANERNLALMREKSDKCNLDTFYISCLVAPKSHKLFLNYLMNGACNHI